MPACLPGYVSVCMSACAHLHACVRVLAMGEFDKGIVALHTVHCPPALLSFLLPPLFHSPSFDPVKGWLSILSGSHFGDDSSPRVLAPDPLVLYTLYHPVWHATLPDPWWSHTVVEIAKSIHMHMVICTRYSVVYSTVQ